MRLILLICIASLAGCGETYITEVTIIETIKEGEWGCIGEDTKTLLETSEGFRDTVCGYWGSTGDKFAAQYTTGHFDHIQNGIKITR